MDFKLLSIFALCLLTKSVTSVPCPSGEATYGQCGQTQYRCPPNSVYSNGVCVMQQYGPIQEPYTNFIQAPSSCGSNMVLYNGMCQTPNVATCPYSSAPQNGICMRNQQYPVQTAQNYQTITQPQSMQYSQAIYQPMNSVQPQWSQIRQETQQLPQSTQVSWPYYQSGQSIQTAQPGQGYYQPGQSVQSTQPYYQSVQPYYQSSQSIQAANPLPQPMPSAQPQEDLHQTQSE